MGTDTGGIYESRTRGIISAMRLVPRIPGVHSRTGSKESNGSARSYDGKWKLGCCFPPISSPSSFVFALFLSEQGARSVSPPELPIDWACLGGPPRFLPEQAGTRGRRAAWRCRCVGYMCRSMR